MPTQRQPKRKASGEAGLVSVADVTKRVRSAKAVPIGGLTSNAAVTAIASPAHRAVTATATATATGNATAAVAVPQQLVSKSRDQECVVVNFFVTSVCVVPLSFCPAIRGATLKRRQLGKDVRSAALLHVGARHFFRPQHIKLRAVPWTGGLVQCSTGSIPQHKQGS